MIIWEKFDVDNPPKYKGIDKIIVLLEDGNIEIWNHNIMPFDELTRLIKENDDELPTHYTEINLPLAKTT